MSKELEQIIFKFLLKEELTFRERQQLNTWLDSDKAHHTTLSHMKLILTTDYDHIKSRIKAETWDWLIERKDSNLKKQSEPSFMVRGISQFLRIAAVLVLISMIGILSYQMSINKEPIIYTEHLIEKVALPGQKITTVLPDGTKVKLNAGSHLIIPEKFTGNIRQVTLIGEAFFEVAHDKLKPFIIKTQQMNVSVLGTTFNVKSYPLDDLIEVSVATGKVAFSTDSQESIKSTQSTYLNEGEMGSYSKSKNHIAKHDFTPSVEHGWKDNLLVFDQDQLTDVIDVLSNWYGISFKLDQFYHSTSKTFSGSYDDPTLGAVIQGLSYVYRFEYEIRKDSVIIKKEI